MKKEKIISDIKTAGVVAAATMTLESCNPKPLTEAQIQTVQQKTDSAANRNIDYRILTGLTDVCGERIKCYREDNKDILKKYSKVYIKHNIKDARLRKFMIDSMTSEHIADVDISDNVEDNESIDICSEPSQMMQYVRCNERWFNDLMLYLDGKYSERQLLNSEFFKTIKDKDLMREFTYNTRQIEQLKNSSNYLTQQKDSIREKIFDRYINEAQRKR